MSDRTSVEALLAKWRESARHLKSGDATEDDAYEAYEIADKLLEEAKAANIDIKELVPDEAELQSLIFDAESHHADDGWDDEADPGNPDRL
jgi:hypothetical protein